MTDEFEGIEKLPKWAQKKVRDLQRQRDVAVRKLSDWEDEQTPGPFVFEDFVCDGASGPGPTSRKKYVHGYRMTVVHAGIEASIVLQEEGIDVHYDAEQRVMGRVNLVPKSYQHILLELPDDPA